MFLLDTNVLSELRRPEKANHGVREWASNPSSESLFVSAISVLELEIGVLRIIRRDKEQGNMLRFWLDRMLAEFADRTVPVDMKIALKCAQLHVPDPRPDRDAYIAATALVHDLTIITRNVRDFEGMGAKLLNPWMG